MLVFSRLSLLEELRLCVASRLGEVGEVFAALRGLASYELAKRGTSEAERSEAVSAPRITANSNTIDVSNRIPRFVTDELAARGYPISRSPFSYVFSGVHAIRIVEGKWDGGADPGRDGMALAV